MAVAELIFDGKHGVGESQWRADEGIPLYWVDIPAKAILCWNSRSGAVRAGRYRKWLAASPTLMGRAGWQRWKVAFSWQRSP